MNGIPGLDGRDGRKSGGEEVEQGERGLHSAHAGRDQGMDVGKLFNLSLDMLCVADFDGYFRIVNSAFENILGHSRQVLLETPFIEFVHPDDRVATLAAMQQLEKGISISRLLT